MTGSRSAPVQAYRVWRDRGTTSLLKKVERRLRRRNAAQRYVPYPERKESLGKTYIRDRKAIERGRCIPGRHFFTASLVPGDSVLEVGGNKGILALLLARRGLSVSSVEYQSVAHHEALRLQRKWANRGLRVESAEFINADIFDVLDSKRLAHDTVVLSRVAYHLRDGLFTFLDHLPTDVKYLVVAGNNTKAQEFYRGESHPLAGYLKYAAIEGMCELLECGGFAVEAIRPASDWNDPVVVGSRP